MTIRFAEHVLAGVPVLMAARDERHVPLPAVVWFHGLGATKDDHRAELERLAEAGLLAVGVDSVGHGIRRHADLEARIALPRDPARQAMLELADATVAELPALVDALVEEGLADRARVAVAGVSMGGYLVYRAVTRMPTLRAAVAMLGSPEWPQHADSPHMTPEAFHGTALLSITAERDASVPPVEARGFHERLRAYHPAPQRERYVELAGAEHLMGADDWARLMDEATGWLARWLAPDAPAR